MVERKGIHTKTLEEFLVLMPGDREMSRMRYVPSLTLTMGNYFVTNHFFVVEVPNTNVVMGVQWLYSLGWVTTNWRKLEMDFTGPDGKLVVLRGMHSYPLQTVSTP